MQIEHVALWTRELDTAAEFWRRTFGASIGERYHSQRRPGFVSQFVTLPGGADKIELITGPWVATAAEGDSVGWDHLAISLGDAGAVGALAARCATEGLLVSPPRSTGDGYYEAVISKPDGDTHRDHHVTRGVYRVSLRTPITITATILRTGGV